MENNSVNKKNIIKEILNYLLIILLVVFIRLFLFDPAKVDGPSMNTTLSDGEVLILNKIRYKTEEIKRFDIVVAKADNTRIIKRVIGLPGDTIYCKDNEIYVNGKKIDNSFASTKTDDFKLEDIGFTKIPGDKYFLLGDNRKVSLDSRYNEIGLVSKDNIVGKAEIIVWPFNKIGKVE